MAVRWYQWPSIERQLVTYGKSFLGPYAFAVELEDDPNLCLSGVCDFARRTITVNPRAHPGPPRTQYLLTRGLLVHEVGHARYTTPRDGATPVVQQVTNVLEDERIERIMGGQFWSVRRALTALTRQCYRRALPLGHPRGELQDPDDPRWVVLAALQWRWAQRLGLPLNGRLSALNRRRWDQVKPLVERAWVAPDTGRVYDLAEQIVAILGLEQPLPQCLPVPVAPNRGTRADQAETRPSGGTDWQDPGTSATDDDELPAEVATAGFGPERLLAPPGPLLAAAEPLASELVARLALPEVARTPEWTDRHGRLSLRAAIRSQDATPFVMPAEPEPDPQSVAVGVLLDRSGSMDGARMAAARVAAATLHLACAELEVWHGVVAFEGAEWILRSGDASERALARLAGLPAITGSCMSPAYEAILNEMTARPETLKVLVIIHDGEPYDPMVVHHLNHCAAEARVEVLGLGIELEAGNRREMRRLFGERFIDCPSAAALVPLLAGVVNTLRQR